MIDINIQWEGPFSYQEALNLNSDSDYGLYQYYGDHSTYGASTLLYLGQASKQTFGRRIAQHNWHLWASSEIAIHIGKIWTSEPLDEAEWIRKIDLAERINLFSHSPSFNTSNLNNIGHNGEDTRVLNWGKRRLLLPEISISRWAGEFAVGHRLHDTFRPQCKKKVPIVDDLNPPVE
ncbi:hypothetical protein PQR75_28155 [Paraburkholderia fungorum]|uniref:hypothetical protein n=1 Tax=Paraburkholderia fungorum TaxID=134537 RepID=UPI0038B9C197